MYMNYSFGLLILFAISKCVSEDIKQKFEEMKQKTEEKINIRSSNDELAQDIQGDDRIKLGNKYRPPASIEVVEPLLDNIHHYLKGRVTPIDIRKHNQINEDVKLENEKNNLTANSQHVNDSTSTQSHIYRRNNPFKNEPIKWIHCVNLVTPFAKKLKQNYTHHRNLLNSESIPVQRLIQLIKVNTTQYTNEEVYTLLLQFSSLQIRLFHWDISAMNLLLDTIIKDKVHSFRALKRGIKALFRKWRLDFSNATNLLQRAKIFRPMCLRGPLLDASTRNPPRNGILTTTTTTESPCLSFDEDGDCIYA